MLAIIGLACVGMRVTADPILESVFDGTNFTGWAQKPAGSFIVNTTDQAIQVSGTARGFCFTATKYTTYRVIYSVRQLNHLHWPCALFFGFNTNLDAMGAIQFQLPNNSAWDYRPGKNVDPHGEGLITSYGKLANLAQSNVWYRCEILVNQTNGTADSAAAFLGGPAVHIIKFTDPTITNIPCAFAFQSHQSGVHDEFKDVLIEVNPQFDGLVTVSLPAPTNLQATAVSSSEIDLNWVTTSTNQTGFKVFHSTDNATWTLVNTLAPDATSYADSGLTPDTTYYYRVSAIIPTAISDYAVTNATTLSGPPPDFTISASPSSESVPVGSSASYTVTIDPVNGFGGTVTLSASGLPTGAAASFNPATITGSGTSTLQITTSSSTPPNTSTVTVKGNSGSLSHSTTVSLGVMDFSLSATPASQSVAAGSATSYTVSAGTINGFSGNVSLSASGLPTGATASFNPNPVSVLSSSTMTVTTSGSTPTGTNTVAIQGTSSGITHTANVGLSVTGSTGTQSFEAENLTWTTSGATASLQTDTNSSGGVWVELAATGTNQYVEFTTPSLPAGNYSLAMKWKGNNNRGILNLKVDGAQIGGTLDQYSATQTYPTTTFGNVTFPTAGSHKLRLTTTGKNAASSGFVLSADSFTLTPVTPTVSFEAESLTWTTNGATAALQTDTNASGGQWVLLNATGTNQYIEYTTPSVPAGSYSLSMMWKGNGNRGILNFKVDGTQVGGTLDQYSAAQTYPTTAFGNVTFGAAGTHKFRLTVTGKNASSSGYGLSADKFTLTGQ